MKTIKYFIILILITTWITLPGQRSGFDIWLNSTTNDFDSIKSEVEAYYQNRKNNRTSGYEQWKRWEYLNESRLTHDGKITNYTLRNWEAWQQYLNTNPKNNSSKGAGVTNGSWYSIGPTSYTIGNHGYGPGMGRVNCIAFHPTDPNTYYIGTPSGGLWKTTDDGSSWMNLCNGIPVIGISGIAIHNTNPNIIYILTGDGDAGNTNSIGVLVTHDGGASWSTTGLVFDVKDQTRGYKLKMHPYNYYILFAATDEGIYKTTDAGITWNKVLNEPNCTDIEFKPGTPTTMYASTWNYFYKSYDTGQTWTPISSGTPGFYTRMEIGVTPANPNYVYLLCGPGSYDTTFVGVYWSTNSGNNFSLASNSPNILSANIYGMDTDDQSEYDLDICVSNNDYSRLMVGGINTWVSDDYGYDWNITSYWRLPNSVGYTHADIHVLAINPLNNHLYCGSDGGIFKSTDFGNNWTDLSVGLSITQFYRIAGYDPNQNLIIGGCQDNGTNKWNGGTSVVHVLGADGMDCMIDHTNQDIQYYCAQNGGLHKTLDGGNTVFGIKPDTSFHVHGYWVTNLMMDPVNSSTIYAGYSKIMKSTDGGNSWTKLSADGLSLAMGTDNPNRIYSAGGYKVYRSDNGGNTWTSLPFSFSNAIINDIAVNPNNSMEIFVTCGYFDDGLKVFKSSNGGSSWTNISGSLPNVIMNCIAYENTNGNPDDALYIGTDVGVFYRNNTLGDWVTFSNWLPTVPVFDLEINEPEGIITAGTFGRGLWRSPTYGTCLSGYSLSGYGPIGVSIYQASNYINSTRKYIQGKGQETYYKAGNAIHLLQGFRVSNGSKFKAYNGPCGTVSTISPVPPND